MMKPILFNTEMVRSILAGQKSVTRRAVKPKPGGDGSKPEPLATRPGYWNSWGDDNVYRQPYRPGNILYVRETWAKVGDKYLYRADDDCQWVDKPANGYSEGWNFIKWRPSIHMPKEAARIFLRVTDVRAERLWNITEEQAEMEGLYRGWCMTEHSSMAMSARQAFMWIWNSTIKKADLPRYGWDANPWVWVIEFERISKEETVK